MATWKENLARWQSSDLPGLENHLVEQHMLEHVHRKMQEHYPGNYHLDWKFDIIRGAFTLYPKFDTPQDEVMFLLKYS